MTQDTKAIVAKGSILSVSDGGDSALILLDAKVVLICDRSSSMIELAHQGISRYIVEDEIVARLQSKYPGQIVLISFSDYAEFCLDGKLPNPSGSTFIGQALLKAQSLIDAGLRGVLISDGEPTDAESEVMKVAKKLKGKLDCVFVGQEGSSGQAFLMKLAGVVGGSFDVNDLTKDPLALEQSLNRLLLKAGATEG